MLRSSSGVRACMADEASQYDCNKILPYLTGQYPCYPHLVYGSSFAINV